MPINSPYTSVDIPEVDLWEFLFNRRDRGFSDQKEIFIDDTTKQSYSYSQVKSLAAAFGRELKSRFAWQKGDVLTICSPNDITTAPIIWGCHWAGGIVNPVSPVMTEGELAAQLKDAGSKAIVIHNACLGHAAKAAVTAGIPAHNVILVGDGKDQGKGYSYFSDMVERDKNQTLHRPVLDAKKDLAFLVYSSGTSGKPKGVMLTHYNIVSNICQNEAILGATPDELANGKTLGFLPFYHIYGLFVLLLVPFYQGVPVVVMQSFNLQRFCEAIQEHHITRAFIVPPVALLLAKAPIVKSYNFSSILEFRSAAAPLANEIIAALHKRLGLPFTQSYGMSEASPAVTNQLASEVTTTAGSVGKLMPNMSAKVISLDGENELQRGQAGELCIKGPNVFHGYYKNPTATRDAFTPDGYYRTGDIGYFDEADNFYITDRVKELIKYKGSQVAPAELEDLLLGHPKVVDCAVIGVYDDSQATELPRAYIVLALGVEESDVLKGEILEWVKERVAPFKRLRGGISWVKAVPKSPTGKILRRVLRDAAEKERKPLKAKI
ncbi:hypothetical protein F5884DRAFT_809886 [Xylogone sp. PMI_703]|nr:hypothetical protein F5884DRAFT_809886 [Xylogone sp. PMI_703]